MEWNFPEPHEDPLYQKHYDQKYGKGAFERDFRQKKEEETKHDVRTQSDFSELSSPFKQHWNSELNIGILERKGKFIGVCVLAAKEITDRESYVRKFGLDFRKDIQWNAASSLIEHLSRSPLFKVVLVTTKRTPFQLIPDVPENLIGRKNWASRNYEYHKESFESVNKDVKAAREFGMFPVSDELRNRQKEEALNAARFLDKSRAIDSQMQEHLKQYRAIKENVFAAALFFYIYTSIHDTFEKAVEEIKSRKDAAKKEATNTYFVKCSDVTDPLIVFSPSFPPYWDEVSKYYNLVLAKDVGNFESDKGVAMVLRKMFTTALEVPKEEFRVEEQIHIPSEEVSIPGERKAFIGHVMSSVVKRKVTRQPVYFPLDLLVRHATLYGAVRSGKSSLLYTLIKEAVRSNIRVVVFDPHGSLANNLRKSRLVSINYVKGDITHYLQRIYDEASAWPETNSLRLLVVLDETREFRSRNLVRCMNSLGKRGVGFLLATQYSTSLPPEARNVGTYWILSSMTEVEMERFKEVTLHPSSKLITRLPRSASLLFSPYFYPEPIFVWHKRIELVGRKQPHFPIADSTTSHEQDQGNGDRLDNTKESGTDDSNVGPDTVLDEMKKRVEEIKAIVNRIAAGGDGGDISRSKIGGDTSSDEMTATCTVCGYTWNPRKSLEEIRKCPKCNSRNWKDAKGDSSRERGRRTDDDDDDQEADVERLGRFLTDR